MSECGKPVLCFDNSTRPCKRDAGHPPNHCNPFSNSYPVPELSEERSEHASKQD